MLLASNLAIELVLIELFLASIFVAPCLEGGEAEARSGASFPDRARSWCATRFRGSADRG